MRPAVSAEETPPLPPIDEPVLAADEIQGNILPGFGTMCIALLGLQIVESAGCAADARRWLAELSPLITTVRQLHTVRESRRAVAKAVGVRPQRPEVLLNAVLSAPALPLLGLPADGLSPLFLGGMTAVELGDESDANGNPVGWKFGATPGTTPHVLLIVGADDSQALAFAVGSVKASLGPGSGFTLIYEDEGQRLPEDREHFGFRDGIAQPGVRGRLDDHPENFVTRRYFDPGDPLARRFSRPGEPLLWPGEFIYGYPAHLDDDDETPGLEAKPPQEWMRNGSFLVVRRLRQDVAAFRVFLQRQAPNVSAQLGRNVSAAEIGAWIVGRWPDGQPLVRCPLAADLPGCTDEQTLNHFDYAAAVPDASVVVEGQSTRITGAPGDMSAGRCPHFAHIRKVNLREAPNDQGKRGLHFRLLRRGIPYGPLWKEDEAEAVDRGLLFLAYHRDLEAFVVLSQTWMNNPSAPEGHGHDLLVGQHSAGRFAERFPMEPTHARIEASANERWIRATGGGFFFAPAKSVFRQLAPAGAG
jgi:Dyp-type peroxidase family